jgi:hypothetical protein
MNPSQGMERYRQAVEGQRNDLGNNSPVTTSVRESVNPETLLHGQQPMIPSLSYTIEERQSPLVMSKRGLPQTFSVTNPAYLNFLRCSAVRMIIAKAV